MAVIDLDVARHHRDGPKKRIVRKNHCDHWEIEIDETARTIICRKCKKVVDPFNMLVRYAQEENRAFLDLLNWQSEVKRLKAEKVELSRDVRNLKAKKKRAAK